MGPSGGWKKRARLKGDNMLMGGWPAVDAPLRPGATFTCTPTLRELSSHVGGSQEVSRASRSRGQRWWRTRRRSRGSEGLDNRPKTTQRSSRVVSLGEGSAVVPQPRHFLVLSVSGSLALSLTHTGAPARPQHPAPAGDERQCNAQIASHTLFTRQGVRGDSGQQT